MLTINEITALAIRVLINFLVSNQKEINLRLTELLEKAHAENKDGDDFRVGTLFKLWGVHVYVIVRGKTSYIEIHYPTDINMFTVVPIKLGKSGFDPINKRVINELNVLFHRDYKDQLVLGQDTIRKVIRNTDGSAFLNTFRLMDRLIGRKKIHVLKTNTVIDKMVEVSLSAVKAVTGKTMVKVFVSTELKDEDWIISGLTAVHFGAIREFTLYGNTQQVNSLVYAAVQDHISNHLA